MNLNCYIIYFTIILILLLALSDNNNFINTFSKTFLGKSILIFITLFAFLYDFKVGIVMGLIFIIINQNAIESFNNQNYSSIQKFFYNKKKYLIKFIYEEDNGDTFTLTQFEKNYNHSNSNNGNKYKTNKYLVNNRFIKDSYDIDNNYSIDSKITYKHYTDANLKQNNEKRLYALNKIDLIGEDLQNLNKTYDFNYFDKSENLKKLLIDYSPNNFYVLDDTINISI